MNVPRAAPEIRTPLAEILARRIRDGGPITFADYMAACLYHPQFGYYTAAAAPRTSDYFTSPDVHPIFGRLLAFQLREMWNALGRPSRFLLVELGAGDGSLAVHVLDYAAARFHDFYQALQYVAVEVSAGRSEVAAARIGPHVAASRAVVQAELPTEISAGVILSNEFFDALPVHLVEQTVDGLREVFVACDDAGNLIQTLAPLSTPAVSGYFAEQNIRLQPGQRAEAGLQAAQCIADLGARIERGFVMTVDYGYEAGELYSARHLAGTLLAYRGHRVLEDLLASPGAQDLTAHINFTALDLWGRRSGLQCTGLVFQSQFLLALARANNFDGLVDLSRTDDVRGFQARHDFVSLIHPDGMGETFRVLIQHKGLAAPLLSGLQPL